MKQNPLMDTDSYKFSHYLQYPTHTQYLYAYLESRGGMFSETVFFGLTYLIKEHLSQLITHEMIEEAEAFARQHGVPFNNEGWTKVLQEFGGHLPLLIRAVPEGASVPVKHPLLTVVNTRAGYHWLVTWFETQIMRLWYPITVATLSYHTKLKMAKWVYKSTNRDSCLDYMLHDFGSRGVSSQESAGIGGMAHLVNFKGSDTIQGILYANHHYHCDMAGYSIPATEHSTMTVWGKDAEDLAVERLIETFCNPNSNHFVPGRPLSIVGDSYNIYNFVSMLAMRFKEKIQTYNAQIVVRPDSGDPVSVTLKVLRMIDDLFGSTTNERGYKVLNNLKVIQGDGMDMQMIDRILDGAVTAGFSAENLVFGMGGGLLQKVNRDTQKFAYKVSAAKFQNSEKWEDVFKDPETDPGKRSKAGLVSTKENNMVYENRIISEPLLRTHDDCLQEYYRDGFFIPHSFQAVRNRAKEHFDKIIELYL